MRYICLVFAADTKLTLADYSGLIRSLPYMEQAFETKRSTWQRDDYSANALFQEFLGKAFQKETLKISRADLFYLAEKDIHEAILAIILWGYPRNMRGNSFKELLDSLETVKDILGGSKNILRQDFTSMIEKLKGSGAGLSTLTKFLYFFNFSLEGNRCLILDKRIIDVIQSEICEELLSLRKKSLYNKTEFYISYLQETGKISEAYSYKPDQLELFLFQFGNNLKPQHSPRLK